MRFIRLLIAAGIAAVAPAHAATLMVANPGFETQAVLNGQYIDNGAPTGWTAYDPHGIIGSNYNSLGVLNPTGTTLYPGGAPQGSNVALVFLWPQTVPQMNLPAGIQQTLLDSLAAQTAYTLTLQVGNIGVMGSPAYNLNGFPGYQVQLLAGGVVLTQDNNTLSPAEGTFQQSTVRFTTGAAHAQLGQPLSIRLINLGVANSGIEVNFDNVQLTAVAVPEPSCLALLGAGAWLWSLRRPRELPRP